MATVYLALPVGHTCASGLLWTVMNATRKHKMIPRMVGGSLANMNFNRLWAEALNKRQEWGHTYFAMSHSDIKAEDGWLDTLVAELEAHDADVMTTVVPLKSEHGLTSTGIMDRPDGRTRRLTLTEVFDLPETFSIKDTIRPDATLAVNNGLFVCRFTEGWVQAFRGFACEDSIEADGETGLFHARSFSEDWNWARWLSKQYRYESRACRSCPLKVMATRRVKVWHSGTIDFSNEEPWGEWETDREAGALSDNGGHEVNLAVPG